MLEDKLDLNELQRRLLDIKVFEILNSQSVTEYNLNMAAFKAAFEYTRTNYPEVFRSYKIPEYKGENN